MRRSTVTLAITALALAAPAAAQTLRPDQVAFRALYQGAGGDQHHALRVGSCTRAAEADGARACAPPAIPPPMLTPFIGPAGSSERWQSRRRAATARDRRGTRRCCCSRISMWWRPTAQRLARAIRSRWWKRAAISMRAAPPTTRRWRPMFTDSRWCGFRQENWRPRRDAEARAHLRRGNLGLCVQRRGISDRPTSCDLINAAFALNEGAGGRARRQSGERVAARSCRSGEKIGAGLWCWTDDQSRRPQLASFEVHPNAI